VGKILNRMGYEVWFSKNGEEAIDQYQQALQRHEPFDVVILDLTVKNGMGGKDAIQELLKIDSGIRCIVSSGYSNDPVMMNYDDYGFVAGVKKPYSYKELRKKISQVIAGA
jgi:CheY-like chemotaxis protein